MADDSWDIGTILNFHPCNIPDGMKDYVLADLTEEQQTLLNHAKREEIRNNNQYLQDHPEIRGLIMMILRLLMRKRPTTNVHEYIGEYFTKPSIDIKDEVYNYINEREKILSVNSTENLVQESSSDSRTSSMSSESTDYYKVIHEEKENQVEKADESQETIEDVIMAKTDFSLESSIRNEEAELRIITSTEIVCREILYHIIDEVLEQAELYRSLESVSTMIVHDDGNHEALQAGSDSFVIT